MIASEYLKKYSSLKSGSASEILKNIKDLRRDVINIRETPSTTVFVDSQEVDVKISAPIQIKVIVNEHTI